MRKKKRNDNNALSNDFKYFYFILREIYFKNIKFYIILYLYL